jgi:PAS domain S-box-containing protein
MWVDIKKWLEPPVFLHDIEKTRLASILDKILIIASVMQILGIFIYPGGINANWQLMLLITTCAIGLQILLRYKYFDQANIGFLFFFWILVTVAVEIDGDPNSPAVHAYIILILWAAFVYGISGGFLMLLMCSVPTFILVLIKEPTWIGEFSATHGFMYFWGIRSLMLAFLTIITGAIHSHLSASFRQIRDELVQRQIVEKELMRFKKLSDHARDIFLMVDPKSGSLIYSNQAASMAYGYNGDELVQMNIRDLHPEGIRVNIEDQMNQALNRSIQLETIHRRKDGNTFPVEISSTPFKIDDEDTLIIIVRDITERKIAEMELYKLNLDLEKRVTERTHQLELVNKELEAFNYSVSHDLRAPLRSMNGFANALMDDYGKLLPQVGHDYISRIIKSSGRMDQLINDLLKLSHLGLKPLDCVKITPKSIASSVWEEIKPDLDDRTIQITIEDMPICKGDPVLIRQVYYNLLSNAIKYTRLMDPAVIAMGCNEEEEQKIYWVKDNGVGFDMKYSNKLFGIFQRLHADSQFEGLGIGLAIVQRIVHRHNGQIWAESTEGKGATFFFTLGESVRDCV